MESLIVRIKSTVLSFVALFLINVVITFVLYPDLRSVQMELYDFFFGFMLYLFFAWPTYLFVGIPVSYLVDYLTAKTKVQSIKLRYIFKLLVYLMISILPLLVFYPTEEDPNLDACLIIVLAVIVGFHTLYFLRKEYKEGFSEV